MVALGDFHAPFHCKKAMAEAVKVIREVKPRIIVQVGDLYDLYSFSRFPRSLNVMTPIQEVKQGRRAAEYLWSEARAAAGRGVECWQLLGNHDERLAKQLMLALPEAEGFTQDFWKFEGVTTMPSERNELILDGILYMHGYRRHGDHVRFNSISTVCGHSHTGGVVFLPVKGKTLFELNCGYLGNPKSIALSYTRQAQISKWSKGVGVIDSWGPRFIPLG